MPSINISDIIGMTITDIRYKFKFNDMDGWLDSHNTYISLNSETTISFPVPGNKNVEIVKFKGITKKLSKDYQKMIIGFKIIDVIEPYHDNEIEISDNLFLHLNNNIFITEKKVAPHGTGAAGFYIYNIKEFKDLLDEWRSDNSDLKSITGNKLMI
jgi:hypothetical protein